MSILEVMGELTNTWDKLVLDEIDSFMCNLNMKTKPKEILSKEKSFTFAISAKLNLDKILQFWSTEIDPRFLELLSYVELFGW